MLFYCQYYGCCLTTDVIPIREKRKKVRETGKPHGARERENLKKPNPAIFAIFMYDNVYQNKFQVTP